MRLDINTLSEDYNKKNILVDGDILLDEYLSSIFGLIIIGVSLICFNELTILKISVVLPEYIHPIINSKDIFE